MLKAPPAADFPFLDHRHYILSLFLVMLWPSSQLNAESLKQSSRQNEPQNTLSLFDEPTPNESNQTSNRPPESFYTGHAELNLGIDFQTVSLDTYSSDFTLANSAVMSTQLEASPIRPRQTTSKFQKENYIIMGQEDIKIQFSLIHQFTRNLPIYGAYTFRGFWLQQTHSAPFKDINHHPEIFAKFSWGELGFEHESNGLDNESTNHEGQDRRSRSLQRAYLRHYLAVGSWTLLGKISAPVYVKAKTDYHDYMGYFDLGINYFHPGIEWQSLVRQGSKGGRVESSLSIDPVWWIRPDLAAKNKTLIFMQYFSGYAEDLLDYDTASTAFRLGLRFLI